MIRALLILIIAVLETDERLERLKCHAYLTGVPGC